MILDRFFPNGNRFFIQENYSKSRMGKGIIVLDREIEIFSKTFLCIYNILSILSLH